MNKQELAERLIEAEKVIAGYADKENWIQGNNYVTEFICEAGPEPAQHYLDKYLSPEKPEKKGMWECKAILEREA